MIKIHIFFKLFVVHYFIYYPQKVTEIPYLQIKELGPWKVGFQPQGNGDREAVFPLWYNRRVLQMWFPLHDSPGLDWHIGKALIKCRPHICNRDLFPPRGEKTRPGPGLGSFLSVSNTSASILMAPRSPQIQSLLMRTGKGLGNLGKLQDNSRVKQKNDQYSDQSLLKDLQINNLPGSSSQRKPRLSNVYSFIQQLEKLGWLL